MDKKAIGKKQYLGCFLAIIMILTPLFSCFGISALAAEQYTFEVEETADIEVSVVYTGNKPTITIVDPKNKKHTEKKGVAKVESDKGIINFYIKSAPAGSWTINSSSEIEYSVLNWLPQMDVSSFGFKKSGDGYLDVYAKVTCDIDEYYNWDISAISDASVTGNPMKVPLSNTRGKTNEKSETSVYIGNLPDGTWSLAMEAYIDLPNDAEADVSETTSSTFDVSGHTKKGSGKKLLTIVNENDNTVTIDWSAVDEYYDEMLVSVIDDSNNLIMYETYTDDITQTAVSTDEAKNSITVRVMPMNDGTFETQYKRTVPLSPKNVKINIETENVTGNLSVLISYDVGDNTIPLEVTLNGGTGKYQIKGKNTLSLPLEAMENNEITIRYTVSDGLIYQQSKTITARSDAPKLTVFGINDRMITNNAEITIAGETDPDATLTANGKKVTVKADGSFSAKIALSDGENPIELVAVSPYGIKTVQTLVVIRTDKSVYIESAQNGIFKHLPVIAAIAVALIGMLLVWLTVVNAKKRQKKAPALIHSVINVLLLFGAVGFAGGAGYCYYRYTASTASISGKSLIELLKASNYESIAQGLDIREAWIALLIKMAIISACFLVALIASLITGKVLKKKRKQKNQLSEGEQINPEPENGQNTPQ